MYSLSNDLKNHTNRPKRPSKEITISYRLIPSLVIQHQRRPYKFSIRFIRRLDKETNQIITYNSVTNTQIPWIVQKEKNLRKECKIETNCIIFSCDNEAVCPIIWKYCNILILVCAHGAVVLCYLMMNFPSIWWNFAECWKNSWNWLTHF